MSFHQHLKPIKKTGARIARAVLDNGKTLIKTVTATGTVIGQVIDATLCKDCKQVRKEKAKEWLKTAGKVVGVASAVAGAIYLASQPSDEDESNNYSPLLGDDEEGFSMKCANCGNINESTLWDEDDTIYCSVCHHRTNKANGKDDLVECPYCHRMRDRKAYYCCYCNDSTWEPSTPKEFKEIDTDLKEMGY